MSHRKGIPPDPESLRWMLRSVQNNVRWGRSVLDIGQLIKHQTLIAVADRMASMEVGDVAKRKVNSEFIAVRIFFQVTKR